MLARFSYGDRMVLGHLYRNAGVAKFQIWKLRSVFGN
jgi:hypothetical protein